MFNALQSIQAFESGQGQRKEREREAAMKNFGNALSMNDYEGASKIGFGIDPALGMQARLYGESQNALDLNKKIAPLVASGDYTGAMNLAAPSGNLDLVTQLQQFKQNATLQERQEAAYKAGELAKIAARYEGMAPDQAAASWAQDQLALQQQGFDPAELAQFDPSDPNDIQAAIFSAQTLSDIQAGQRYEAQQAYTQEIDERNFGENVRQFNVTRQDGLDAAAAEAAALSNAGNPAGLTEDQIKLEVDLSNRWAPMQANFADIQQQFNRVSVLGSETKPDGTPMDPAQRAVNDLALVVAFTKMLDPGSVAREGEVELTKKSASLLGEAQTWLPRLEKGGTLLPPATRKALVDAAKDMMPAYERAYQKLANDNVGRLNAYGLDPSRVMLGYEFAAPEPVVRPGTIEDGWEFVGGNPGDKNNWRRTDKVRVTF